MSVNNSTVLGHLGADPLIHTFEDGGKTANFSVATSEKWKDKNTGEPREHTEWHRVVARNGLASIVEQFLKKGNQVYVEGKMRTRQYKDKADNTIYITEIIADKIEMIGGANKNSGTQPDSKGYVPENKPSHNTESKENNSSKKEFTGDIKEDIPF